MSTYKITKTHTSAVSRQLRRLGYTPYGQHNTSSGGYTCRTWPGVQDSAGGDVIRVMYDGVHRELKGAEKRSAKARDTAHLERLSDMMSDLKTRGYTVTWGWTPDGAEDKGFIVVSGSPLSSVKQSDGHPEPEEQNNQDPEPPADEDVPVKTRTRPVLPVISLEDAEQGVEAVTATMARGEADLARRMESHLYYQALVAVVSGHEDAVDVAATVLQTQSLLLPR